MNTLCNFAVICKKCALTSIEANKFDTKHKSKVTAYSSRMMFMCLMCGSKESVQSSIISESLKLDDYFDSMIDDVVMLVN